MPPDINRSRFDISKMTASEYVQHLGSAAMAAHGSRELIVRVPLATPFGDVEIPLAVRAISPPEARKLGIFDEVYPADWLAKVDTSLLDDLALISSVMAGIKSIPEPAPKVND